MTRKIATLILTIVMTFSAVCVPVNAASIANRDYNKVVTVNKNQPNFTAKQKKLKKTKVVYSRLDSRGRCGRVFAVLDKKHLAKGKRGSIGMYKPSGWPTKIGNAKYDFIDGKYLFNRSHLLGWQLFGNSTNNKKNLVTGTRQFNATDMLKYENKVAGYLKSHGKNHVVYRVTPLYRKKELIPRGVQMEAWSVEDKGRLKFNVYVPNIQKGVAFSYFDGKSYAVDCKIAEPVASSKKTGDTVYYLNISTHKFHVKSCRYASGKNIEQTNLTKEQLIEDGYVACKVCNAGEGNAN